MRIKNELRTYENLVVRVIDGEDVVEKNISPKEIAFFDATRKFDFILKPIKVESDKAYYPYLKDASIIGKPKKVWEEAARAIACLAAIRPTAGVKKIPISQKKDYVAKLSETVKLAKENQVRLPERGLSFIRERIELLDFSKSYSHDDLIALNVLDKDAIKIIDWEHVRINYPESDIGRFLGDLYFEKPKKDKYYYPTEWHDDLVKVYLDETKKLDPHYDTEKGAENIKFAELWNYLGPIQRVLKDGGKKDEWFFANVYAFNELSSKLI